MRFRQKKELDQAVDISPLIDMVFILLIFFMVSTTFVKDMKLDLERPGASSATRASSKVIKVYLDNQAQAYIDNQPIKVWALQSKLRDMLRTSTEKSVLVVTDDTIAVEKLIEVVDQCRLSGAKDVAVATNKEVG
ncbi:biopolymer transporter ExbD [Sulfurimonas sp. HSL-3221]|uniref:Biopolymer transporter ExbD n=1 Tax=Sulfurimonas diazotrophicus TaxID=3131939 RepID=A0ABZ3H8Q6_9BACT|nr:biopolymer transporter ExbD [Sulfurimonas sp. HSL-3221]UFS61997.1 biopolymer transporter ExbD [Sulfurimonas sp. HSL-3221]